jgi:hypothetical protein
MTDNALPDDLTQWPTNPYELLRVDVDIDERGLKRAYAKLIHKFSPEHHPQHFVRIRAAFEQVLNHLHALEQFHDLASQQNQDNWPRQAGTTDALTDRNQDFSFGRPADDDVLTPSNRLDHQQLFTIEEVLEAVWQTVLQGNLVQGYRDLAKLATQFRRHGQIYLRLYWLHRIYPELDSTRHYTYWLITGLQQSQYDDSAWKLYFDELRRYPYLAGRAEHLALLQSTIPPWRLHELLEHRCRAALQLNSWEWICKDLDLLRDKLKWDDSSTWVRVLFQVFAIAVWSSHPLAREIVQQSKNELEELSEIHSELRRDFIRFDRLLEAAADTPLDQLKIMDEHFPAFGGENWWRLLDKHDPRLKLNLESWVANPKRTLKLLTGFWKHARHLFTQIRRSIKRLERDQCDHRGPERWESIRGPIQQFLLLRKTMEYRRFRAELLAFCVENRIALDEITIPFEDWIDNEMSADVIALLNRDRPLKIVLHGVFAFWK